MLFRVLIAAFFLCLVLSLGACGSKVAPQKKDVKSAGKTNEEPKVKRKVVQAADGSYYEVLEEYERLCDDCDR